MTEFTKRLDRVTALSAGTHPAPNGEFMACVMEAASYVAGEPWSANPECTCPVIAAFMMAWNDRLQSDGDRTRLLLPLVPKIIGTKGSAALEEHRSLMAADWLVRVHTPAWLLLAGLRDQAATLEALPEITSAAQAATLRGPLEAIRVDAAHAGASVLVRTTGIVARPIRRPAMRNSAAAVVGDAAIVAGAGAVGSGALDACRGGFSAAVVEDAWWAGMAACRIAAAAVADAATAAEDAGEALSRREGRFEDPAGRGR